LRMRWLLCLTLMLISTASALPDFVQMGQYKVSFDLKDTFIYTIETEEFNETKDGINFVSHLAWLKGEKIMLIALTEYPIPMEVSTPLIRQGVIEYLKNADCTGIDNYVVTIDQKPGVWGWGKRPYGGDMLCAIYWPDIQQVNGTYLGQVDCTIVSDGAPTDATENLLNTIHVELPKKATEPEISLDAETDFDDEGTVEILEEEEENKYNGEMMFEYPRPLGDTTPQ